jgi:hypothetical protein
MSSNSRIIVLSNRRFPESIAAGYLLCVYRKDCKQLILNNDDSPCCEESSVRGVHFIVLDNMWKDAMALVEKKGATVTVRPDEVDHFTFLSNRFSELQDISDTECDVIDMFMYRHIKDYDATKIDDFFLGAQQLEMKEVFELGVDKVREIGGTIADHTSKLVANRVISNGSVLNGRVALCQATEHINLTHNALHKRYGMASITLTYFSKVPGDIVAGEGPTSQILSPLSFTVSMRGYNGFDVLVYAKKYGGGGTTCGAGISKLSHERFMSLLADLAVVDRYV